MIVVLNYMGMSMLLAMDTRGIGAPEEFLNRPHAWAWFVVVVFVTAMAGVAASYRWPSPSRRAMAVMALVGVALLLVVQKKSHNLETFPQWEGHGDFAEFNAAPVCLTRAAQYVRENARLGDVMQDSHFDPGLMVTALAERQAYVIDAAFGGAAGIVAERLAGVRQLQASGDESALKAWAATNRVRWYLLRPDDAERWPIGFLQQASFTCDDWRVFKLN